MCSLQVCGAGDGLTLAVGGQVKLMSGSTTVKNTYFFLSRKKNEFALLSTCSHAHRKQTVHAALKHAGSGVCCILQNGIEGQLVFRTGHPGTLLQHVG